MDYGVAGEVDLINGNEVFFDLVRNGRLKVPNSSIALAETELGWVAEGSVQVKRSVPHAHEQEQWPLPADEAAIEQPYKETHAKDEPGRFKERFPFNGNRFQFGYRCVMAKKYNERLESRSKPKKRCYQ